MWFYRRSSNKAVGTNWKCSSFSLSNGSQEAFELYYSETYSESSSVSLQDSHRSLASTSDGADSNPALLLMQEYMITVSVDDIHHLHKHRIKSLSDVTGLASMSFIMLWDKLAFKERRKSRRHWEEAESLPHKINDASDLGPRWQQCVCVCVSMCSWGIS